MAPAETKAFRWRSDSTVRDFLNSAERPAGNLMPSLDLIANHIQMAVGEPLPTGWPACLRATTSREHLLATRRLDMPRVIVVDGYQRSGDMRG